MVDFVKVIQDDSKLAVLEGFFDALFKDDKVSLVSDVQCQKEEEARAEYHSGNNVASSLGEVEMELKAGYGF